MQLTTFEIYANMYHRNTKGQAMKKDDLSVRVAHRLSNVSQANGGPFVTEDDYLAWQSEGKGDAERCEVAIYNFLGHNAASEAEELGRLDDLLLWALKLGPRDSTGIDLQSLLFRHNSRALLYRE